MKQISKFAGARRGVRAALLVLLFWASSGIAASAQSDPLPSWNEGAVKKSITDFVTRVTFAFDRVKAMAPQHPEWKATQPFKALLDKDMKALAASGEKGLLQIVAATSTGMTTDAFSKSVLDWMATAKHPSWT